MAYHNKDRSFEKYHMTGSRKIWSKDQILDTAQIKRGAVIYIRSMRGGGNRHRSSKTRVIVVSPTFQDETDPDFFKIVEIYPNKKGEEKEVYITWESPADSSIIPYEDGCWNNINYITTKGQVLSEEQLTKILDDSFDLTRL